MSYKFVIISDKYIEYLRKYETRIMSNKADSRIYYRKYLGIIENSMDSIISYRFHLQNKKIIHKVAKSKMIHLLQFT